MSAVARSMMGIDDKQREPENHNKIVLEVRKQLDQS